MYIKMNARGRQLSKYENLKAFIEKDSAISKDISLLRRIDTNWSDYFFDPKNISKFDLRGCNFLHYATLFFRLENDNGIIDNKEIIAPNHSINDFYEPLRNIDNIKLLDRAIELFEKFKNEKCMQKYQPSFFNKDKLGYVDICYFFSILFYVKENENIEAISIESLRDYQRVCRHFIENHRLDKPEPVESFFRLFRHLSKGCNNIYEFLSQNPNHTFHSNIYKLEVKKAKLILESRRLNTEWEAILNKTSEHRILVGWVDYLLDFSDEKFEFEEYIYNKDTYKNPKLEQFKQYAELTTTITLTF
ncbi:hypothetical protein CCY99_07410 [Helicobacter sp. 16-1353]|uniref:hypothetical protein n=1 Tax=Helicobacter sp. 16-1353 TaxID=2004996 RepID=UPI000DCCF10F|nr:hypothetical protein [Helicobacter sp. 16-1353]RAX52466.1 hypothetical protein CCY99_07410 [Helicobacter sp. 16-1353]